MTQPFGAILTIADIAKAIGWRTRRVRRILKEAGAITKIGGRWVTTQGRLRAHMPEVLDALQATALAAEQDDECEP